MFDCHADMLAFEREEVALPGSEQTEMRKRRNTNRDQLKTKLKDNSEPSPIGCRSQGSYAMRTMVQDTKLDYDIDDGVYFDKGKLKDADGNDRSAADIKEIVRKALHRQVFNKPVKVMKTCVRVFYNEGYHVDVPAYRRSSNGVGGYTYEVASTDWKFSDPLKVTDWFKGEVDAKSPDTNNGGQMRRIVRLIKAYARSRNSWKDQTATGLMISKLVSEEYAAEKDREDRSLRDNMRKIANRLATDEVIQHPVIHGQDITKDVDKRPSFLREKLDWALAELEILDDTDCTQDQAREAWDKVFNTTFFGDRGGTRSVTSAAILKGEASYATPQRPSDPRGGGRYG